MTPSRIESLLTPEQAVQAVEQSRTGAVVVYKHSPTCSLCSVAIEEFEAFAASLESVVPESAPAVRLLQVDVLAAHPASQTLEERTGVRHESPQILILAGGKCVWNTSHTRVRTAAIQEALKEALREDFSGPGVPASASTSTTVRPA